MDELLKILKADEKKIDILTLRYNGYKKNIEKETKTDTIIRTDLGASISAMKKSNALIVSHYLGEQKMNASKIDEIVKTYAINAH